MKTLIVEIISISRLLIRLKQEKNKHNCMLKVSYFKVKLMSPTVSPYFQNGASLIRTCTEAFGALLSVGALYMNIIINIKYNSESSPPPWRSQFNRLIMGREK